MSSRERDRERDGYYSDRNELIRERERERERDRGYLSDHNSRYDRCDDNQKLRNFNYFFNCQFFIVFLHLVAPLASVNQLALNGFVILMDGVLVVQH